MWHDDLAVVVSARQVLCLPYVSDTAHRDPCEGVNSW